MLVCVCEGGVGEAPVVAASPPATAEAPRTVVGNVKSHVSFVHACRNHKLYLETHMNALEYLPHLIQRHSRNCLSFKKSFVLSCYPVGTPLLCAPRTGLLWRTCLPESVGR